MKQRRYSSEGLILRRRDYGEADRIITLFSKKNGKITLIAKGVRRLQSRKRGHLEVFSLVKFSAGASKSLDILTEVELIKSYSTVRNNLKKATVAYFMAETVSRITRDEEENQRLFALLQRYLLKLQTATKLRLLRFQFIYEILVLLGFWPLGKKMGNPDKILENVLERKINSVRVGKEMLK